MFVHFLVLQAHSYLLFRQPVTHCTASHLSRSCNHTCAPSRLCTLLKPLFKDNQECVFSVLGETQILPQPHLSHTFSSWENKRQRLWHACCHVQRLLPRGAQSVFPFHCCLPREGCHPGKQQHCYLNFFVQWFSELESLLSPGSCLKTCCSIKTPCTGLSIATKLLTSVLLWLSPMGSISWRP